ncbi:MAG: neutral/alkaline non-lysosomal ceramidase N-terminal domain-containing protein [Kiritimatiellaeota bacterium]|nr:neutral/alkaline non-lysosomal ceramidase N-terminal domain-containing protein [Kiritimatiellota bacterium]
MKRILVLCSLACCLVNTSTLAATPVLRAGAAAADVSPKEFPLNMPGGFSANMAEGVNDPLHARALVLDDGVTALGIVVVDNLGVAREVCDEAKALAASRCALKPENVLVCATHTHSAPSSNSTNGPAPAVAYRKVLVAGIAEALVRAHAALRPAAVGVAAQPLPEEVFNRRWYLKPGQMPLNPFGKMDQVKMNPGTSPDVLDHPAGPTDPDVTILDVQEARGHKPLALLANYSLHYVGAMPHGKVSADYYGEFARLMPSRVGGDTNFVAMMSNGTSGDINNIPFGVGRPPREPFEQIRIVAGKAADAVWLARRKIEKHATTARLGMVQRELTLRYRRPTAEQLADAKAVLAIKDKAALEKLPRLAEHYARNVVAAAGRTNDTVSVQLQALRIGDFAICGIPFETFAEIGLELKKRSPFPRTMVIGLANARHGYLPTPAQHKLGGYETWLGTNHVQEDASDLIIAQLLDMLAELAQAK